MKASSSKLTLNEDSIDRIQFNINKFSFHSSGIMHPSDKMGERIQQLENN
jgi:hypothetical protein